MLSGMLLLVLAACSGEGEPATCEPAEPEPLFGQPSANTGLADGACGPVCGCGDEVFEPGAYTEEDVAALISWTLLDPPPLADDPYDEPAAVPDTAGVCAVVVEDEIGRTYRLETFADRVEAGDAGAVLTHEGACGLCSSLQDLAVYMGQPDLTDPVRTCGITGALGSPEEHRACLADIGFSPACAEIWRHNTNETRAACIEECLQYLDAPHHLEDGSLNPCLQCDEEHSGPVFKAVAGRTRRNSGLPSALCRPCGSVAQVLHTW
jgi:hypothetical protein